HRDDDVDQLEVVDLPPRFRVGADDALLRERGVQVDDVWHHRRTEDPGREQDRGAAVEMRHKRVRRYGAPRWTRLQDLQAEGDDDHAHERADRRLETAESP